MRTVARPPTLWPRGERWVQACTGGGYTRAEGREEAAGSQDLEAYSTNRPRLARGICEFDGWPTTGTLSTADAPVGANGRCGTSELRCVGPQRPKAHNPGFLPSSSELRDTKPSRWSSAEPASSTGRVSSWARACASNWSKLLEAASGALAVGDRMGDGGDRMVALSCTAWTPSRWAIGEPLVLLP